MEKDFIPKFSDIESDWRERLKNDVSKYLPEKKIEKLDNKEEINSHPEEQPKKLVNKVETPNPSTGLETSSGSDTYDESQIKDEKKFNKNQKLTLALICAVVLCAGVLYYLGTNNYFKATYTDNSTCVMQNITIPECPVCPSAQICPSLTCPVQIINITVSNHS